MFEKRKDYIELLDKIYSDIFPYLKANWGFNPWPIIRIQTGYFFHCIFYGKYAEDEFRDFVFPDFSKKPVNWVNLVKVCYLACKNLLLILKMRGNLKRKTLLVGSMEHSKLQANGKYFNMYLDPFKDQLELIGEKSDTLIFDEIARNDNDRISMLYKFLYFYHSVIFSIKSHFSNDIKIAYKNSKILNDYLRKENIHASGKISFLVYQNLIEAQVQFEAFNSLLNITKPKIIWTYVFYNNTMMALARAANKSGIDIIEYQHSVQSDDHFAYAKWNGIDRYSNMFPNKYWLWKNSDKERIERNFKGDKYYPLALEGGNLFLSQEKARLGKRRSPEGSDKMAVLVCLQGIWIPNFLEEFIRESKNFNWYFRVHPRYPEDLTKLKQLKSIFPEKIEIEFSNKASLYELFQFVDYNITSFSGTALEAQCFGVQNIIFGEEGLETFYDFIKNKCFFYVDNKADLSLILEGKLVSKIQFDEIITDIDIIQSNVKSQIKKIGFE